MNRYNCVKCGGPLEPAAGETVTRCPWCKDLVAVPKMNAERFNRANSLRMSNQFDRAAAEFEKLAGEEPEDAQCYWNLLLCRYGIEYVEDSKNDPFMDSEDVEKVPTCHRMSYDSILEDENYKNALRYADDKTRRYYQEQAALIDRKLKEIISVARTQEDYDVFISFKDTDTNAFGNRSRTVDSLIGQEIYDKLTEKGYRVFYSRVTLRRMGGQDYEPLIFAALHSARMMLVVGTSREHMEAPWVRNEWGRYRELMREDKGNTRHFAVVYRDMAPEDFPKEFGYLKSQAFDASVLGFEQNVADGVEALIGKASLAGAPEAQENLLMRGEQELAAGNEQEARRYFEQTVKRFPRSAKAWWALLEIDTKGLTVMDTTSASPLSPQQQEELENALSYADEQEKGVYTEKYNAYLAIHAERYAEFCRNRFEQEFQKIRNRTNDGNDQDVRISREEEEKLYALVTEEQKQELDQFLESYHRSRGKYFELEQRQRTGYLDEQIKNDTQAKQLKEQSEKLRAKTDRLRSSLRAVGVVLIPLPLLALIPWAVFLNVDVNAWMDTVDIGSLNANILGLPGYLLFHLCMFASVLAGVTSLLHLFVRGEAGIEERESSLKHERRILLYSLIPAALLYLGEAYLVYRDARVLDPELSVGCIFCGFIFLVALVAALTGICLVIKGIVESFSLVSAVEALVGLFVLVLMVALIGGFLCTRIGCISEAVMDQISGKYQIAGLAVIAAAAVLRLLLVLQNHRKIFRIRSLSSKLEEAQKDYRARVAAVIEAAIEEYRPYMDSRYLTPWYEELFKYTDAES